MEIRKSNKSNFLFAALGILIIVIVFIKNYFDHSIPANLLTAFAIFFGTISTYFLLKSYNQNPIYIINEKGIFIPKHNVTYEFENLAYYRHERIGSRYGHFDYLFFYNFDNTLVFKINVTLTDHSLHQLKNKLKNRLKQNPNNYL